MLFLVGILWDELRERTRQLQSAEQRERGASALEWAIIAAISVVIATVIGAVVYNLVNNKATQVQNCGNQPVGAKC